MKLASGRNKIQGDHRKNVFSARTIPSIIYDKQFSLTDLHGWIHLRVTIFSGMRSDFFSFTDLHEHIHLSVTIFRETSAMVLFVRSVATKQQESL